MKIADKATFNRLSQDGKLGNYLRKWDSIDGALASGCEWFTIQDTRPASPYFVPVVHKLDLYVAAIELLGSGQQREYIYYREIPPPHYLYLKIGQCPTTLNLRDDLKQNARILTNTRAVAFLYATMGEELETLTELWAKYPDAIIEFTYWSKPMGVLGKRLLIWEVRDY